MYLLWYGRELVQIDKLFPSSKICSFCENIKKDLIFKDRILLTLL